MWLIYNGLKNIFLRLFVDDVFCRDCFVVFRIKEAGR